MPASAPAKEVKTVCPYCGVGCGVILHVSENRVERVSGDAQHPANFGRLCTKGITCGLPLSAPDRLLFAQVRSSRSNEFVRASLDEALSLAASRLQAIMESHGPDALALYVSGQISLEAQYLANKLCKGFLKTNNIDSNSRLCMSSAASGYKLSLGADGPPGSYRDIEASDCFFVIGSNMAECHPVLFLRLLDRRKSAGSKLIVVDPRRTATAEKADLFLQVRPGTDLALLNGILHLLVANRHIDEDFIKCQTHGWEELSAFVRQYAPSHVAAITGITEQKLQLAARWIGQAKNWTSFWTMGLNQSTHGTWHTNALCNLHLATGKICKPGSGPFSLTGQPNAMGGREVGYLSHGLPGQRSVTDATDRAFVEKLWGIAPGTIRPAPGLDAVRLFDNLEAGELKAVWIIGTNPVATIPNRRKVLQAFQKAELIIVQDGYHPTESSRCADILLPGALWAEAEGTMVNSERTVTLMQKAIEPRGDARPDWELVAQIARKLGFLSAFSYSSASAVFNEIRQTANPATGYDLRGMNYQRLRTGPLQWPCSSLKDPGEPIRYLSRARARAHGSASLPHLNRSNRTVVFPTPTGKAKFFARPYLPPAEIPDHNFPFILITGRVPHQWHTRTKTGKVPLLNKINPAPFLELNPRDCQRLEVENGTLVRVRSARGEARLPVLVSSRVLPGTCFASIHWNDLFGENLAINAVTHDALDPLSLQPELKFCAVHLQKVSVGAAEQRPSSAQENNSRLSAPAESGEFNSNQKVYLLRLITGLNRTPRETFRLPVEFSEQAPFTFEQRIWLSDLLENQLQTRSSFNETPWK